MLFLTYFDLNLLITRLFICYKLNNPSKFYFDYAVILKSYKNPVKRIDSLLDPALSSVKRCTQRWLRIYSSNVKSHTLIDLTSTRFTGNKQKLWRAAPWAVLQLTKMTTQDMWWWLSRVVQTLIRNLQATQGHH